MSRWPHHLMEVTPAFADAFARSRSRGQERASLDRLGAQGCELVSAATVAGATCVVPMRAA